MSKEGVILYIADDADDQEMMVQALEELGIRNKVVSLRDGGQAFQYLKNEAPPSLIFCDYKLSGLDGVALRRRIEADEKLRDKAIPFVFFSITVSQAMVKEVYGMNVQGLFEKASRFEEIKDTLNLIYASWRVCKHPNN